MTKVSLRIRYPSNFTTKRAIPLNFSTLYKEIRNEILDHLFPPCKINARVDIRPIIHEQVTSRPWWKLNGGYAPAHIIYEYSSSSENEQSRTAESLMVISKKLTAMVKQRKPCYLQIDEGQRVYVHPARDTIYFGLASLFSLGRGRFVKRAFLDPALTNTGF